MDFVLLLRASDARDPAAEVIIGHSLDRVRDSPGVGLIGALALHKGSGPPRLG